MKMFVHPTEHKPESLFAVVTNPHLQIDSIVIYWFHVPNIDSYSFYNSYLFIFE